MQEVSLAAEYFMFSTQVDGDPGDFTDYSDDEDNKTISGEAHHMYASQVDGEFDDLFWSQVDGEPDIVLSPPPLIPILSRPQQDQGGANNRLPDLSQQHIQLHPQQQPQNNTNIRNNMQSPIIQKNEITLNQILPGETVAGQSSMPGGGVVQTQVLSSGVGGQNRMVNTITTTSSLNQIRFVPSIGNTSTSTLVIPSSPASDNSYSCELCPAKLKNKRNFDTHMKRHRGELPFKCDECPKTFQGRRDLETHKRSRHSDQAKRKMLEYPFIKTSMDQTIIRSLPSVTSTSSLSIIRTPSSSQAPSSQSTTTSVMTTKSLVLSMNGINASNSSLGSGMLHLIIKQPVILCNNVFSAVSMYVCPV